MSNRQILPLSTDEMLRIYEEYASRHFPPNEVKPLSSVKRMSEDGTYIGYGLYEEDSLLCYALFTVLQKRSNILLDYFAVLKEHRSTGIGSAFLTYMQESGFSYGGLMIEAEDPDAASDEKDRIKREKRLSFYFANHATDTGIRARVFGVSYRLLYLPITKEMDTPSIYEDLLSIYQYMVSPKYYESQVSITFPTSVDKGQL